MTAPLQEVGTCSTGSLMGVVSEKVRVSPLIIFNLKPRLILIQRQWHRDTMFGTDLPAKSRFE